jgi:hypothetical protein
VRFRDGWLGEGSRSTGRHSGGEGGQGARRGRGREHGEGVVLAAVVGWSVEKAETEVRGLGFYLKTQQENRTVTGWWSEKTGEARAGP